MAATDARPVPRKNVAFRYYFALRNVTTGALITSWAGADSEVSKDGGAFADCTNEATEIGTSGCGYIDLTATELNADGVILKVTFTNPSSVPYVVTLFPEESGDYRADATMISGDSVAADNLEAAYDGTGYFGNQSSEFFGTAQAGAASTITLKAGTTLATNSIIWREITIVRGTGKGQCSLITAYDSTTKVATVAGFGTAPDNTSEYEIGGYRMSNVLYLYSVAAAASNLSAAFTGSSAPAFNLAANALTAAALATDAVNEIVDAVWDEATSGHTTAGTTGKALTDASSAGDPWSTALPGAYAAGTAGKIVGDNVNATISSRATQTSVDAVDDLVDTEVAAIKSVVDAILLDTGTDGVIVNAAGLQTDAVNEIRNAITGGAYPLSTDASGMVRIVDGTGAGELDTSAGTVLLRAATETQIDAIETDTNELQVDWTNGGRLDLLIDQILSDVAALNDISAGDVLTTQLSQTYAANGTVPTLTQAILAIHQRLMHTGPISGTSWPVKNFAGSGNAFVMTLNDATNPTGVSRV